MLPPSASMPRPMFLGCNNDLFSSCHSSASRCLRLMSRTCSVVRSRRSSRLRRLSAVDSLQKFDNILHPPPPRHCLLHLLAAEVTCWVAHRARDGQVAAQAEFQVAPEVERQWWSRRGSIIIFVIFIGHVIGIEELQIVNPIIAQETTCSFQDSQENDFLYYSDIAEQIRTVRVLSVSIPSSFFELHEERMPHCDALTPYFPAKNIVSIFTFTCIFHCTYFNFLPFVIDILQPAEKEATIVARASVPVFLLLLGGNHIVHFLVFEHGAHRESNVTGKNVVALVHQIVLESLRRFRLNWKQASPSLFNLQSEINSIKHTIHNQLFDSSHLSSDVEKHLIAICDWLIVRVHGLGLLAIESSGREEDEPPTAIPAPPEPPP
ncbi:hypothetical protein B566_EDAN006938 [Ephemera danica]|nr:hypothetical protein B566_EDAN006938 [Ephemera danica]